MLPKKNMKESIYDKARGLQRTAFQKKEIFQTINNGFYLFSEVPNKKCLGKRTSLN